MHNIHICIQINVSVPFFVDVGSRTEQSDVVLGPLRTALSIGARSTHPWQMMMNICTQLVEAYGNPNLSLGEVDDNSTRLKVAIK